MRIGWMKSRNLEKRAWRLFETRFLRSAQSPESQQQIDSQLVDKLSKLGPENERSGKLRRVVDQAAELWARRSQLRKTDVLWLAAALLYFISPLDAVPDIVPGIGYVDDALIVSAVVGLVVRGLSALGSHGKERLEEWIDQRTDIVLDRLDESATSGVHKTVVAVVISLWGTTTAAAVSLAVAAVLGGYSAHWLMYVIVSAAIVLACNVSTAVYFWREYRKLDGAWQQRLRTLVVSKLTVWHFLAIGLPILVLIGLGICRVVSAI
jgi:uncharacterized membrane protein YkvA (DUF1232 family)